VFRPADVIPRSRYVTAKVTPGDGRDDDKEEKAAVSPFPHRPLTFMHRESGRVSVRVHIRDADTRDCRCGIRANALRRFSRPSVPALLARGCTCHRSWCFQRPHPRARARVYAETRRLSYFLTIASRSPRSARIPFGPPRVQDAATDDAAALRYVHGFPAAGFSLGRNFAGDPACPRRAPRNLGNAQILEGGRRRPFNPVDFEPLES